MNKSGSLQAALVACAVLATGVQAQPINPWLADGLNRQINENRNTPRQNVAPTNFIPRYGALAISDDRRVYALITSREGGLFSSMPQSGAIEACQSLRPGSTCKVQQTFRNQCLAIAWSTKTRQTHWTVANGLDAAEKSALATCNQESGSCVPVTWNCAMPGDGSEPSIQRGFLAASLMTHRMLAVDKRLKVLFVSPKTEQAQEARVLVEAGAFPVMPVSDNRADIEQVTSNPGLPKTLFYGFSNSCVGVAIPDKGVRSEKDFFITHASKLGDARVAATKACHRIHGENACGFFKIPHEQACAGKYDSSED